MSTLRHAVNRSAVIRGWIRRMVEESNVSENEYAGRVAEVYISPVPERDRTLKLRIPSSSSTADEHFRTLGTNAKLVHRLITGEVNFPSDAEESAVKALPQPWRDWCRFDLCARHDVLPVLLTEETDVDGLADMMIEAAETVRSMAPIMADGVIDAKDRPFADNAIDSLSKLASKCAGLIAKIAEATDAKKAGIVEIGRH